MRVLTLWAARGVSDSMLAALLAQPHLRELGLEALTDWEWSTANLGKLRARLAEKRPDCLVEISTQEQLQ